MDMMTEITADVELDCIGLYCPVPIAQTREEIDRIEDGQILKVVADDPAAEEDFPRWAKRTGHEILSLEKKGTVLIFYIKKRN
jgi:TusA-related sulfurtransferase